MTPTEYKALLDDPSLIVLLEPTQVRGVIKHGLTWDMFAALATALPSLTLGEIMGVEGLDFAFEREEAGVLRV